MTCEETRDRLDDYADGTLGQAEIHEVELHIAACAACADEERRLRAFLARVAAMPTEVRPGRDLWPGIAARIAATRPRTAGVRSFPRAWWTPAAGLAAAAAVVVALGATLSSLWTPAGREGKGPETAVTQEAAWTTDPTLLAAERDYVRATAQLLGELEARRATLPAGTVSSVEKDLTTIDAALAQVRSALRAEPGNAQLSHMLAATHQKKVDVLRRIVKFSS